MKIVRVKFTLAENGKFQRGIAVVKLKANQANPIVEDTEITAVITNEGVNINLEQIYQTVIEDDLLYLNVFGY
jgi:hypothetical protein